MARKVTWRSWSALVAGLAAYAALGWFWSGDGAIEEWLYRIGLTAAAVLPLLFLAVYTAKARWFANPIGTALTLSVLAVVPTTAPLAYVFWFQGGRLTASWLAWLAVSGPALSALALAGMIWVWLRVGRGEDRSEGETEEGA
jgi:hypothetical protein